MRAGVRLVRPSLVYAWTPSTPGGAPAPAPPRPPPAARAAWARSSATRSAGACAWTGGAAARASSSVASSASVRRPGPAHSQNGGARQLIGQLCELVVASLDWSACVCQRAPITSIINIA